MLTKKVGFCIVFAVVLCTGFPSAGAGRAGFLCWVQGRIKTPRLHCRDQTVLRVDDSGLQTLLDKNTRQISKRALLPRR